MDNALLTIKEQKEFQENMLQGKIMVVFLPNPFSMTDRDVKYVSHIGQKLSDMLIPYCIPQERVNFSINGELIPDDFVDHCYPNPGDVVAIAPKVEGSDDIGKDILYVVGMIALSMFAPWAAGLLGWGEFWTSVVTYGIQIAGGLLLYNWIYGNTDDGKNNDSPHYSFGTLSSISTPGSAIPMTFGTVKTAGQILSQHIYNDGEKQYLKILLAGGEGPCDYTGTGENSNCTGINNFRINGNKSSFYKDIQINKRAGLNTQSIMQEFNDVYADEFPGLKLLNDNIIPEEEWRTWTTDGDLGTRLELTIGFPTGLYYTTDQNNQVSTWVKFEAQWAHSGTGVWHDFTVDHYLPKTTRVSATSVKLPAGKYVGEVFDFIPPQSMLTGDYRSNFSPGAHVQLYWDGEWYDYTVQSSSYVAYTTTYNSEMEPVYTIVDQTTVVFTTGGIPANVYSAKYTDTDIMVSRKTTKSFHYTLKADCGTADRYDVRIRAKDKSTSGTESRYVRMCMFEQLSHISTLDFAYPNTILLGIKALATDQLSGGRPSFTWDQTRTYVWVWDPTQSTPGYVQKRADNPAWAAYDIIHRCQQLRNPNTSSLEYFVRGIPYNRIDYYTFAKWAEYCDYVSSETDGQKRCVLNYILDVQGTIWDSLRVPSQTGRGAVIIKGTKFSAICDRPLDVGETPVGMFNTANVKDFKRSWVNLDDRANAIEVTFLNKDKNYERDTFTVYADGYDAVTAPNPRSVNYYGITDYDHAYREAWFELRVNQYITEGCSFSAFTDSISCEVNDVIIVQHSRPGLGGVGGRVESATTSQVVIDRDVTMSPGKTYSLKVRYKDDSIVSRAIVAVQQETTTHTINLATPFTSAPEKEDLFILSEITLAGKPYRVIHMQRDGELMTSITCMEFIQAVYAEAATIPVKDYTVDIPESIPNISLTSYLAQDKSTKVNVRWPARVKNVASHRIEVNGEVVGFAAPKDTSFTFETNSIDDTYEVRVVATTTTGVDVASDIYTITPTNAILTPVDTATNVSIAISESGIPKVQWNAAVDASNYNVYRVEGSYTEATTEVKAAATLLGKVNTVEYVDSTMVYGTQYSYFVAPLNPFDFEGNWSAGFCVNIPNETVRFVDVLPTLPNADYPVGSYVSLTTDGGLYVNYNEVWSAPVGDGMIVTEKLAANSVVTGKIAAGAIGTQELSAGCITAEKIGANEIIVESANIKDGIITSAKIQSIEASKITLGEGETTGTFFINSDTDKLFHFDNDSLLSTDGIYPEVGYDVTTSPTGGKYGGSIVVNTQLQYQLNTIGADYTIGFYSLAPSESVSKNADIYFRRSE